MPIATGRGIEIQIHRRPGWRCRHRLPAEAAPVELNRSGETHLLSVYEPEAPGRASNLSSPKKPAQQRPGFLFPAGGSLCGCTRDLPVRSRATRWKDCPLSNRHLAAAILTLIYSRSSRLFARFQATASYKTSLSPGNFLPRLLFFRRSTTLRLSVECPPPLAKGTMWSKSWIFGSYF